jgi:hypothetical protein
MDGPNAADLIKGRRHAVLDEPHEGADGRQPSVPRAGGVVPLRLEMVEELQHERRVEVLQREVGGRHAELVTHEREEELKGVGVGVTGMWTRSQASATARMSRGVACRYQHVSVRLRWPRYFVDEAFFACDHDERQRRSYQAGARNWAGGRPNLLNVAVTRAKEALYVVGNRQLWRRAGLFRELDARLP